MRVCALASSPELLYIPHHFPCFHTGKLDLYLNLSFRPTNPPLLQWQLEVEVALDEHLVRGRRCQWGQNFACHMMIPSYRLGNLYFTKSHLVNVPWILAPMARVFMSWNQGNCTFFLKFS
jgi:hypothetical protein